MKDHEEQEKEEFKDSSRNLDDGALDGKAPDASDENVKIRQTSEMNEETFKMTIADDSTNVTNLSSKESHQSSNDQQEDSMTTNNQQTEPSVGNGTSLDTHQIDEQLKDSNENLESDAESEATSEQETILDQEIIDETETTDEEQEDTEPEKGIEIDISVDDVAEDLLKDRTSGLLVAEDEAEEEILFKEEEWIPPLTRWTKLRRYFARFSLARGILIIILVLMGSFTMITYMTGQSINEQLDQGLQELNDALILLKANSFTEAQVKFLNAKNYFLSAKSETEIYRLSLLLNLPITITSFVVAPEVLQGANILPSLTDGFIGISQAYFGSCSILQVLQNQHSNPYVMLLSATDTNTLQTASNQAKSSFSQLLNDIYMAEGQKEKYLRQLEIDLSGSLSGTLREFYQTFSSIAKQLDDLLSLYRIGFEVTITFLEEINLALEIIGQVNQQNWALAKSLLTELEQTTTASIVALSRMNSEVINVDGSWYQVPLQKTLDSLSRWITESRSLIEDEDPNSATLMTNALINQVLPELEPIILSFSLSPP